MIRLLLSDVDGTLVRSDKSLSERTIEAVHRLHRAGVQFAITSSRPPRGMAMLVEPLDLRAPLGAFNGGLFVDPAMEVLERRSIDGDVVGPAIELLDAHGVDVWVFAGADWLVRDPDGPHVAHESEVVRFTPTVVDEFETRDDIAKVVGVSDDHEAVAVAAHAVREELGTHVSASRSQPYYVDVTNPDANKGSVVTFLSRRLGIATDEIATIGDMPNDVLMFAHSGVSIAMGNADREVQRAARHVTTTNDGDGFANAVHRYILGES